MKAWLKWGLIGLVINIFLHIGFYLNIISDNLLFAIGFDYSTGGKGLTGSIVNDAILSVILAFIAYFIIGAIIGYIIGKIKSKKLPVTPNPKSR